jgi:hypothetical protein
MTGAIIAADSGNGPVAAAYLVFLFLVLVYIAIMAVKLQRIEREVVQIVEDLDRRERGSEQPANPSRSKEPVG